MATVTWGRRRWGAVATVAALATLLAGCGGAEAPRVDPGAGLPTAVGNADGDADDVAMAGEQHADPVAPREASPRPNIVLVQMDDFSVDLERTMRSMAQMRKRGAVYTNSFVVDSLCCVSRTSLFTGQYPHQTGVRTNTANDPANPVGGFEAFTHYGNGKRSFNVRLQRSGYTTGYIGKYLNQYEPRGGVAPPAPRGWSQFQVIFGSAYAGWGFQSARTVNGQQRLVNHPKPPAGASRKAKDRQYAGTVTQRMALDFIRTQERRDKPYFLQVAPYAVHSKVSQSAYAGDPPFPPAFRDRPGGTKKHGDCGRVDCRQLRAGKLPGFADRIADNAPRSTRGRKMRQWRPGVKPSPEGATRTVRDRARMAQSVDRMVRKILKAVGDNTYVVFTSDNGFHIGQHGLGQGKGAPYDSDVRVPLYVVGPGVVPGKRTEMVSNLDLAPTFERLAGLKPAKYRAGQSLVPTFADPAKDRRDYVFIEHLWAKSRGNDPDKFYSGGTIDDIPSYLAVRSERGLLVRLEPNREWRVGGPGWEYYDYTETGWEKTNSYVNPRGKAAPAELRRLHRRLVKFRKTCEPITRNAKVTAACRALTR